jgi:hypothetical protein
MAYKIFNNTGRALCSERENGFIVLFSEKRDFKDYQFNDLDGKAIVEAIWSPSGFVDAHYFFFSKVWFSADKVRSFNDLCIVKRDPAYPERFIETPVKELKESVFQAILSCSFDGVSDDELQDLANLRSTFEDDLRRARDEVERFAHSWRCRDGSVLPAHDQKVIIQLREEEKKRVDPSLLLHSYHHLMMEFRRELHRRGLILRMGNIVPFQY